MAFNINNLGINNLANRLFPPNVATAPALTNIPQASYAPGTAPVTSGNMSVNPATARYVAPKTVSSGGGGGGGGSWGPTAPVITTQTYSPFSPYTTPTGAQYPSGNPSGTGGAMVSPVPGSVSSLPGANFYTPSVNSDQLEIDRLRGIVGDTSQETDPNTLYQNTLREYQSQIDAINNIYNDQLTNSRIVNAPTYKARLDQNRIGQVMGGLVASPIGEAQTNNIQTANEQEQAAAEAIINDQKARAISAIHGEIRKQSNDMLAANKLAKSKGADAMLEFYNVTKPAMKAKQVFSAVKALLANGINIKDLTPEELKSYTDGLGVAADELVSAYREEAGAMAQAEQANRKTEAEIAKTEAQTQKELSDVSNWGKMTEYQKAQIAVDTYKAKNPTGTLSEKKASALGSISQELNTSTRIGDTDKYVMDANGFVTPEGYKYMVQNAPALGVDKKDILETFGQLLYRDKKGGYSSYGLTPADEKILTGELPAK